MYLIPHLDGSGGGNSAVAVPIAVHPGVQCGVHPRGHAPEGALDELPGVLHAAAQVTHHIEGGIRREVPALPEAVQHVRAPLLHL